MGMLVQCSDNPRRLRQCADAPRQLVRCPADDLPANLIYCTATMEGDSRAWMAVDGCGISALGNGGIGLQQQASVYLPPAPYFNGIYIRSGLCAGQQYEPTDPGGFELPDGRFISCNYRLNGRTAYTPFRFRIEDYHLPGEGAARSLVATAQFDLARKRGWKPENWQQYTTQVQNACCWPEGGPPTVEWNPWADYMWGNREFYAEYGTPDEELWRDVGQLIVTVLFPDITEEEQAPNPITLEWFLENVVANARVFWTKASVAVTAIGDIGTVVTPWQRQAGGPRAVTAESQSYVPTAREAIPVAGGGWVADNGPHTPAARQSGFIHHDDDQIAWCINWLFPSASLPNGVWPFDEGTMQNLEGTVTFF